MDELTVRRLVAVEIAPGLTAIERLGLRMEAVGLSDTTTSVDALVARVSDSPTFKRRTRTPSPGAAGGGR